MKVLGNILWWAFVGFMAYATLIEPDNTDPAVVNYEEPLPMELANYGEPGEGAKIMNAAKIMGRDYAWKHVKEDRLPCLFAAGVVADNILVKYHFSNETEFKLKAAAVRECANVAENNGFVLVGRVFEKRN